MNCLTDHQELTISCLIQYENAIDMIESISLKFSFEEQEGLIPSNEYKLTVPIEYTVYRLVKGYSTDIVITTYAGETRILFYDTESTRIVAEYLLSDLGPNFQTLAQSTIWESPRYIFNFATPGVNFREFLFRRKTRIIKFTDEVMKQNSYDDYYLVVHGVKNRTKVIQLNKIFNFESQIALWVYILLFGLIGLCSLFTSAFFLYYAQCYGCCK